MAFTKTPRVPACHPDRKHQANGLCTSCYDKQRYHSDPSFHKQRHQDWSEKNQGHLRSYRREWGKKNPVLKVLGALRANAKKREIPFALTEADLREVWTEVCPVFGVAIFANDKRENNSLSVDRIDNSAGYVPGNICVMSWRANRLKVDASIEELESLVAFLKRQRLRT